MQKPFRASEDSIKKGKWWDLGWSLVEGCQTVDLSCQNCWARQQAQIRRNQQNPKVRNRYTAVVDNAGCWTTRIMPQWSDLNRPLRRKKPAVWSIWNDFFAEELPIDFQEAAIVAMLHSFKHSFLILTKRIERAAVVLRLLEKADLWPLPNVGVGVSVPTQEFAWRIDHLFKIPAAMRFVSAEPLLSGLDLRRHLDDGHPTGKRLDWVICGPETGRHRRPTRIEHVSDLLDQCVCRGVPFFLKALEIDGRVNKLPELHNRLWDQTPRGPFVVL